MIKTFPLLKIFPLNIQSFGKLPEEGHWDETMFPTIKYVVFYRSRSAMKIPFIIRRLVLSEYILVYYGACYCCCFTTPHLYKIIFQLFFLSCYFFFAYEFLLYGLSEKLLSDASTKIMCTCIYVWHIYIHIIRKRKCFPFSFIRIFSYIHFLWSNYATSPNHVLFFTLFIRTFFYFILFSFFNHID